MYKPIVCRNTSHFASNRFEVKTVSRLGAQCGTLQLGHVWTTDVTATHAMAVCDLDTLGTRQPYADKRQIGACI